MSFSSLSFTKAVIPGNYQEIIDAGKPLSDALKKKGFTEGQGDWVYWRYATKSDVSLSISKDEENGSWHHRIEMATSGDEFDEFEEYIKAWAAANDQKGDKNFLWASWFCEKIEADPRKTDEMEEFISVSAPSGRKAVYISVTDIETYKFLLDVVAKSLTELAKAKFKQLDDDLIAAATDISKIEACAESIFENLADLTEYKDLWMRLNDIFAAYGVVEETLKLLSVACAIPGKALKKGLSDICAAFDIPGVLKDNAELSETMFYDLQSAVKEFYLSQSDGYATKGLIKKTAKLIAVPVELFGFGIHHEGLKTLIRVFENDAVEGIGLEMYQDDVPYDSEDFGYYDGIENEEFYDQLWSGINMAEMI